MDGLTKTSDSGFRAVPSGLACALTDYRGIAFISLRDIRSVYLPPAGLAAIAPTILHIARPLRRRKYTAKCKRVNNSQSRNSCGYRALSLTPGRVSGAESDDNDHFVSVMRNMVMLRWHVKTGTRRWPLSTPFQQHFINTELVFQRGMCS